MRTIKQDVNKTISKVSELKGMEVKLRVNRGRNKIETYRGIIENAYPAVFTLNAEGKIYCFSYADILSGNVRFFRVAP